MSTTMLGVVHHFLYIAFWKASELISRNSSLTSSNVSTLWFWVGIFLNGWLLLIFSDISQLTSSVRLPILLLLILIVLSWRWCNLILACMLNPLLLSFHLSLLLVPLHLFQTHTLPWWTKWLLCPWDTQRTQRRFWLTKKNLRTPLLMIIHHIIIIKLV